MYMYVFHHTDNITTDNTTTIDENTIVSGIYVDVKGFVAILWYYLKTLKTLLKIVQF